MLEDCEKFSRDKGRFPSVQTDSLDVSFCVLFNKVSLTLSLPPAEVKKEKRYFSHPKHAEVLPCCVRYTVGETPIAHAQQEQQE